MFVRKLFFAEHVIIKPPALISSADSALLRKASLAVLELDCRDLLPFSHKSRLSSDFE